MKGCLITFYGINNIGKSTQCRILCERLRKEGRKVHYLKYPLYGVEPSGAYINRILRAEGSQKIGEEELQMWFSLNRYQFDAELRGLIDGGYIVIAEDYSGTGVAWGMAKGLQKGWLEALNKYLLKEDLGILLEGKRRMAAKEKDHVHEQNDELVEKCRLIHLQLAEEFGWKKVQMRESIEESAELIGNLVDDFLA